MAHYAKVLNGKVLNVIKADPEFFNDFVDDSPGEWIETSYNMYGGVYLDENRNPLPTKVLLMVTLLESVKTMQELV